MKVSIRQLSKVTGFSPATISNVLNKKKGVNKETAKIILKAAADAGYINDSKITSIRLVIFRKHGKVVGDTPFFSSLIAGIENECRNNGYDTVICHLDQYADNFASLMQEILEDRTTANLVLATELNEEDIIPFRNTACPVVMVDCWFESMNFDCVLIDNTDSVCNAANYLIQKGHRKIGYLKSNTPIQNFIYREIGYRRALLRAELEINPDHTVELSPSMDGSYRDMNEYLDHHNDLPTAFCADNDNIALGACKALQEHGYKIPEDVSVIGFDDMPFCEISTPALTTIRVFKEEMGAMAVKRLVDLIKNNSTSKVKMQICTEFIERESVKCLDHE